MRAFIRVSAVIFILLVACGIYISGIWYGWYGDSIDPGNVTNTKVPAPLLDSREEQLISSALAINVPHPRQILFGDLHVHTSYSSDAFLWGLPLMNGQGINPPADACDFARFCSGLDFWSINDHAGSLTPKRWQETKASVRQCNAVSGDADNPDLVTFLGWEWTQVANTANNHYGHKNVIFLDQEEDKVPVRPIAAGGRNFYAFRSGGFGGSLLGLIPPLIDLPNRQIYYDFDRYSRETVAAPLCAPGVDVHDLPNDCVEWADKPGDLFRKLNQWGFESLVIPHGTSWGATAPRNASWVAQLVAGEQDPQRQKMIEVYSGHGNSEEYRNWRGIAFDDSSNAYCPEPAADYTANCWQAGEIIRRRCLAETQDEVECESRAILARQHHVDAGKAGTRVIPAQQQVDWLDAGQCKDCFLPAYNYRPGFSAQAALAIRDFTNPENPTGFRFGLMASSDNHSARPGTGYKEMGRVGMTEQRGIRDKWVRDFLQPEKIPAVSIPPEQLGPGLAEERQDSFWHTGGLVAVHAQNRDRTAIWEGLSRKEIYGTSGPRILLWFDLINADTQAVMGGEVRLQTEPRFKVRALGEFKQAPGCPDYSVSALSPERIQSLCMGECYNPTDERRAIKRIEVIRIRPQIVAGEDIGQLIEDPWQILECPGDAHGCVVEFSDPEFRGSLRDAVYYVRAIQESTPAVNGGGLRCEMDKNGVCVKINACYGGYRTADEDNCLAEVEERAWSSPIFVDYGD